MIRHTDCEGGSMRVDICTNLWKCYSSVIEKQWMKNIFLARELLQE